MYSGTVFLMVICATTYIAVAKPITDSSLKTTAESTAQSSTRSIQNGANGQQFSQAQSIATSSAEAGSTSQSEEQFYQLFKFIREQQVCSEEEFKQLLEKLENLVEEQYSKAAKMLKQWNKIEALAEHEEEAETGLAYAKNQLLEIISKAGNNLLTNLNGCNKDSENFQNEIQELRQKFESSIEESLIYFIKALEGINSIDFQSSGQSGGQSGGQHGGQSSDGQEPRCLDGKKKKLAARSIGSGIISKAVDTGKGMAKKAVDTGKGMNNSGMEFGTDMVNQASSAAGSFAESGIEMGSDMINSAQGIGEGMAENVTGFSGQMTGGSGLGNGSYGGRGGSGNGRNCEHGPHDGRGPHGGKGPHRGGQGPPEHGHGPRGPGPQGHGPQGHGPQGHGPQGHGPQGYGPQGHGPQGHGPQGHGPQGHGPQGHGPQGHGPQGHGPQEHGQGQGEGNRMNLSSGEASSAASAGTVQEYQNDGDDFYSSTTSSARSYAGAESGVESKSLSI